MLIPERENTVDYDDDDYVSQSVEERSEMFSGLKVTGDISSF